ncbi:unnamed protein product, partial [Amoebophrya sp. A120]|eukprot:GSA120T00008920001.1
MTFSSTPEYAKGLKTLRVSTDEKTGVAKVELNRPKKLNAMDITMFQELKEVFPKLCTDGTVLVIILTAGDSKVFCSGIDLEVLTSLQPTHIEDVGRKSLFMMNAIKEMQESCRAIQLCTKPVIGVAAKLCIGAGLEMFSACDIRYCTTDCILSVREPRMGLAADVGALQRMPRLCTGNTSL